MLLIFCIFCLYLLSQNHIFKIFFLITNPYFLFIYIFSGSTDDDLMCYSLEDGIDEPGSNSDLVCVHLALMFLGKAWIHLLFPKIWLKYQNSLDFADNQSRGRQQKLLITFPKNNHVNALVIEFKEKGNCRVIIAYIKMEYGNPPHSHKQNCSQISWDVFKFSFCSFFLYHFFFACSFIFSFYYFVYCVPISQLYYWP